MCWVNEPPVSKVYSPTARLPRKLVSKIQNLEFIEMSELLPEAWISDAADDSVGQKSQSRRRSPISEISVWVECFAMMAAVLAEKFPSKAPQLFIYMRRIVHAARNYRRTSWVAYDRLYRRQAVARCSLDWAVEDSALYNKAFVGQVKFIARCKHCLSEYHGSENSPEFSQPLLNTTACICCA